MAPSIMHSCRRAIVANGHLTHASQKGGHRFSRRPRSKEGLRDLHPEGSVLEWGYHRVSGLHRIYYEVHGNPNGEPAVVLHGGPGAGCSPALGRLFDLDFWKVILFDQRGCGLSVPKGLLHSNNTRKLVGDIEKLRYHLKIKKWLVFGGSHGSTLALCYAQEHTSRVTGLVLRAICLMRQEELDWMFSSTGIATQIPKAWLRFMSILEPNERKNPIKAYYNRMLSLKDPVRNQAVQYPLFENKAHNDYDKIPVKPEDLFSKPVNMDRNINLFNNRSVNNVLEEIEPLPSPVIQSLIESHFFYHNKKYVTDIFPILERIDRIRDVPCIAIHGEEDPLCRKSNATALKSAWKEMDLRLIPEAGHSQFDPAIRDATIEAIEEMRAIVLRASAEYSFHGQAPLPTYRIPEPYYKKKYR